jgi:hypothetical protein
LAHSLDLPAPTITGQLSSNGSNSTLNLQEVNNTNSSTSSSSKKGSPATTAVPPAAAAAAAAGKAATGSSSSSSSGSSSGSGSRNDELPQVWYHCEPHMPHAWGVLPLDGVFPKQQMVLEWIGRFAKAEKASAAAVRV